MIVHTIKENLLEARKAKDSNLISILSTLLGEVSVIGKNDGNRETTDAEAIRVVKKFIKNIDDTTIHFEKESTEYTNLIKEKEILQQYLPKQLTSEELIEIINQFLKQETITSLKQMGCVMKFLKENYNGRYDGKEASDIVKSLL